MTDSCQYKNQSAAITYCRILLFLLPGRIYHKKEKKKKEINEKQARDGVAVQKAKKQSVLDTKCEWARYSDGVMR